MKCKKCQNLVFEYLDKTASKRQEKTVEKHLRHCESCRAFYEEEERLGSFIEAGMEDITASLSLDIDGDRLERLNIPKKAAYNKWSFPGGRIPALTSVAALLILCIIPLVIKMTCMSKRGVTKQEISPALTAVNSSDLLYSDSLEDWQNRRMVITVQDKNGKITRQIITSGSNKTAVEYVHNNNNGG